MKDYIFRLTSTPNSFLILLFRSSVDFFEKLYPLISIDVLFGLETPRFATLFCSVTLGFPWKDDGSEALGLLTVLLFS